jgi:hypothetical protein
MFEGAICNCSELEERQSAGRLFTGSQVYLNGTTLTVLGKYFNPGFY